MNFICKVTCGEMGAYAQAVILRIPEKDWVPYRDREIAETVHCMQDTKKAFRLIVTRKARQQDLFEENGEKYFYHAIASNRVESAPDVKDWYCKRGDVSENGIKELKCGLGMERMPSGDEKANALFFRIGVLAYNLFILFKANILPNSWKHHQLKTIRWKLYQVAGKITRHAHELYLKVSCGTVELFNQIRLTIWQNCQPESQTG